MGQRYSDLNLGEYLIEVKELSKPKIAVIFTDLILSCSVYYGLFFLSVISTNLYMQIFLAAASGFAFFRCLVFIHESYHLKDQCPKLGWVYDILFGLPQKMPTFIYAPHKFHHLQNTYGTQADPEYEQITKLPKIMFILSPIIFLLVPSFYFIRHGLLPMILPFIGRKGRSFVLTRLSTFAMNLAYIRPQPTEAEKRQWYLQELGTYLYNSIFIAAVFIGFLPLDVFFVWYIAFYVFYAVNYYRVLVSHRYVGTNLHFTAKEQVLDSVTVLSRNLFHKLLFPLGLQYHTLHHMYPTVPCHNLEGVHKMLLSVLPPQHPYRAHIYPNYFLALRDLLSENSKSLASDASEGLRTSSFVSNTNQSMNRSVDISY